jgi:hypothetical protein
MCPTGPPLDSKHLRKEIKHLKKGQNQLFSLKTQRENKVERKTQRTEHTRPMT